MRTAAWITIVALATAAFAAPAASAHESYDVGDGEYTLTVGDQNEPIYTYKWTNLDLVIRDSEGNPVSLAEEELSALNASLEAPGGEILDRPLERQFGEEGRYEFAEGHFYTQPGQYKLLLEGEIDGADVTGSYDLPGPRQSMSGFGFPHEDVPTPLSLRDRLQALEEGEDDGTEQRIRELESQVATLEQELQTLREDQQALEEEQNSAPGLGVGAALAAIAGVALIAVRREC